MMIFQGVMCTWERVASGERKWYRSNETYWMNVPVLHVSRIQKSHFAAVHDVRFFSIKLRMIFLIDIT